MRQRGGAASATPGTGSSLEAGRSSCLLPFGTVRVTPPCSRSPSRTSKVFLRAPRPPPSAAHENCKGEILLDGEQLRSGWEDQEMEGEQSRRRFLQATVALGAVGLAGGGPGRMSKPEKQKKGPAGKTGKAEEEVSLAEDLMREHGVLKRVLLVYGESLRRLGAREELPPEALADSARIIRSFIEDYHEKLEEDFLFPRFRKANTLVG